MRWLEWLFPRITSPLEGCSGLSPLSRPCLDQKPSCPCSSPLKRAPSRSVQAQGGFSQPDRQPRPAAFWLTAEKTENVWATKKGEMWGPRNGLRVLLWQGLLLLLWRKLKEVDIHKLKNFPNRIHHKLRRQVGTKASTISTPVEKIRIMIDVRDRTPWLY